MFIACGELVVALVLAGMVHARQQESAPLERVVPSEWMPLPVFVAPEVRIRSAVIPRSLGRVPRVEHELVGNVLEVHYTRADDYYGVFVALRLERTEDGQLVAWARGGEHSCVSNESFVDLHGEVRLQARSADDTGPLHVTFRVDAIVEELFTPLRVQGGAELELLPAEWGAELVPPSSVGPGAALDAATLRDTSWWWTDGALRARGHVDVLGRRQGLWETWSTSGALETATEFLDGERHGRWCIFDETMRIEGTMNRGLQDGEWIESEGNVSVITYYENGRVVGHGLGVGCPGGEQSR